MRYLLGGLHRSLTVLADTCGLTRDRVLSLQFRSIRRLCGRQRRASHYRSGGSSSEFIPSGQTEGTSTSKTLRVWPFPQSTDLGRAENTSIFTPHFKERYRIKDHHSRVSSHKQGAAVRTITSSLHPSDDRGAGYTMIASPTVYSTTACSLSKPLPTSVPREVDAMEEEPPALGELNGVPHEIILMVLSYLSPEELLLRVSLVSKALRVLAIDDYLWRRFCLDRWGDSILKETESGRTSKEQKKSCRRKLQWGWVYRWRSLVERNWWRGQCSVTTIACPAEITCVQTDGLTIASGSYDHKIRLWDLVKAQWVGDAEAEDENQDNQDVDSDDTSDEPSRRTKRHIPMKVLQGHSHRVYCLQFTGNTLMSGSDDHTVKAWNIEKAECSHTFAGHTRAVRTLQFDNDSTLISGSYDKTIKVWDTRTGDERATLRDHSTCICCLKFNEKMIVSGSFKVIKLWDFKTHKQIAELQGHESWVTGLQFDDHKLVSGSMDNSIKMWDLRRPTCPFWTLGEHTKRVRCLQFDGQKLCSGSYDFTIKVWDLAKRECVVTLKGHNASARSLHFTDDVLVSGSLDKSIKIWDFSANVPFE